MAGHPQGAPFFVQLSLPSPAHFVIFSPFLAVSQYFVVPLHKNNNKLQENGKDYIRCRVEKIPGTTTIDRPIKTLKILLGASNQNIGFIMTKQFD